MKSRLSLLLFLGVFAVACSGDSGDAGAMTEEAQPAATEVDADAAAVAGLEALRAGYVEHYNLHHASMVADFYTDEAVALLANGQVRDGREAILAGLEADMEGNPTLSVETQGQMVFGDVAVTRGTWTIDLAPEGGDPMSMGGYYMGVNELADGEWKIGAILTNYDASPPEGTPTMTPDSDPPPDLEDNPWAEMTEAWGTHFNMGHASMVADLYAEDAITMWGDEPLRQGRAEITAALETQMAEGSPQIELHDVRVEDLGDGWHVGLGWYRTTMEDGSAVGGPYMVLTSTAEDGSQVIHWDASHAAW